MKMLQENWASAGIFFEFFLSAHILVERSLSSPLVHNILLKLYINMFLKKKMEAYNTAMNTA